jgi:4-amino-4-deoxy-L-arabinose transferase-like glycosyltransferase
MSDVETHGAPSDVAPKVDAGRVPGTWFWKALGVVTAAGIALRVVNLVVTKWDVRLGQDDAAYYAYQGRLIREGHWFVDPFAWLYTHGALRRPSASHPPLFSLLTAAANLVGLGSINGLRLFCCFVGGVGIVVVALLGREIAGPRVGIIAGALAAAYPLWWVTDDQIMPEVLYLPLAAGVLLLAYRVWKRPKLGPVIALGVVGGCATLTRSEGLLLLVLVVGVIATLRPRLSWRRRVGVFGTTMIVAGLLLTPWIVYNASRFDRVVLLSTNDGATIADSNCPATYSGKNLGLYVFGCHVPAVDESGDESVQAGRLRHVGIQYARDHLGRVPIVVAARIGRVWGVYRPFGTLDGDAFGRWSHGTSRVMALAFWLIGALGVGGLVVLRRRRVPISPIVAAFGAVTITAATTYGIARFRVPGDAALVVLAAVALDALIRRWRREASPGNETAEWDAAPPAWSSRTHAEASASVSHPSGRVDGWKQVVRSALAAA